MKETPDIPSCCLHQETGWCVYCVDKLKRDRDRLKEMLEMFATANYTGCDQHKDWIGWSLTQYRNPVYLLDKARMVLAKSEELFSPFV